MNGKKLKEIRKELNLTQTELANLIGRTTMRTVQNWEGDRNPIPDFVEDVLNKELENRNTPYFASNIDTKKRSSFNELPIGDQLSMIHGNYASTLDEITKLNLKIEAQKLMYLKSLEDLSNKLRVEQLINRSYLRSIIRHLNIKPDEIKKAEEFEKKIEIKQ